VDLVRAVEEVSVEGLDSSFVVERIDSVLTF